MDEVKKDYSGKLGEGIKRVNDQIDKRLDKLVRDFDELLGKCQNASLEENVNSIDRLIGLGLTMDEAKRGLN